MTVLIKLRVSLWKYKTWTENRPKQSLIAHPKACLLHIVLIQIELIYGLTSPGERSWLRNIQNSEARTTRRLIRSKSTFSGCVFCKGWRERGIFVSILDQHSPTFVNHCDILRADVWTRWATESQFSYLVHFQRNKLSAQYSEYDLTWIIVIWTANPYYSRRVLWNAACDSAVTKFTLVNSSILN